MPSTQRMARLAAAAIAGIAVLFVATGLYGPTMAVVAFTSVCFLLRCALVRGTIGFAALVAVTPMVAFAAGLSVHMPVLESIRLAMVGYASQPPLLARFVVGPIVVGCLFHWLILRMLAYRGAAAGPAVVPVIASKSVDA